MTNHGSQPEPTDHFRPQADDFHELMGELRIRARALLRGESHANRLQTTSLVLRALERQARNRLEWYELTWENREHFFRSVYRTMKRELIDQARLRKRRQKAGFDRPTSIDELLSTDVRHLAQEPERVIEALLQALQQLETIEPKWAEAIHHHFFGGLTLEETAGLMEVDVRTLFNWRKRAYDLLRVEMVRSLELEG